MRGRSQTRLMTASLCAVVLHSGVRAFRAHLPLVEVVEDLAAEVLLALPLALGGVVEEVPERPVLPLEQLPVQQQGERRLCGGRGGQRGDRGQRSESSEAILNNGWSDPK